MAQNKAKFNKFMTGAVTATMVATAIVPVASAAAFTDIDGLDAKVKAEVGKAVELGFFKDGEKFNPATQINRGQAALTLARYIAGSNDLKAYAEKEGLEASVTAFKDVPASFKDGEDYQVELFYASLIVKKAGAFTQENLNATGKMTRSQMAKVIVSTFGLEKAANYESKITDIAHLDAGTKGFIETLAANEVTNVTTFNPAGNVTRSQMASFLVRSYDVVNPVGVEGIVSVKAINDTRYEVTFGKAFDKDVAREIEKEPGRIIAFHGGQNENSDDALVAETVTFDSANKVATVTFDVAPTTDINYTVALMDNEDNTASNIVSKSSPQVLVKGAETPTVDVNAAQDKVVVDFKQKMDAEALDIANYTLHDDKGNKLDLLSVYAEVEAAKVGKNWKDATTKQAVEFKLLPAGTLEAGKTYKIVVDETVTNDDGDKLASNKRTVNFKTPSISEARPEAKFATVKGDTIEISFDKDLDQTVANLTKLVKVKTATGKEVKLATVEVETNANGSKKLVVEADETLDKTSSYTVSLPENVVSSAYFYNALNKSVNIKAESQEDVIVKSMKAAFEVDAKTKTEANLVLTFDQNVTQELGVNGDLEIRVDGQTYTLDTAVADIEYGKNGKELRVKNVKDAFGLVIENGKSYEVVAKAGAVETDSDLAPTNKDELKTTISANIDVTAPQVDRMELVSANEIVLTFDKDIKGTVKAKDVKAAIRLVDRNGGMDDSNFAMLGDENYIKVTTSGKKLTIKTADDKVKFVTGDDQNVTIKENAFNGSNDIENEEVDVTSTTTPGASSASNDFLFIDNAAPEIIGAQVTGVNEIELTYSEAIETKSTVAKDIASQFTLDGTEIKNYGTTAAAVATDSVTITFTPEAGKEVFKVSKDYPNLKIKYVEKSGHAITDENNNKAKAQTKTGASK